MRRAGSLTTRRPGSGFAATALIAVFRIDRNRSKAAWQRFRSGFAGILCTDRYAAYADHPISLRQLCWALLKCDIQALVDTGSAAVRVGRWGIRSVTRLIGAWRDFKDLKIDRLDLSLKGLRFRSDFGRWLAAAARGGS